MPRPDDIEIISQNHTFVLQQFGTSGRRVVRIVFVVKHKDRPAPSGPFTVDVPVEDFTAEKAWAAMEEVAAPVRLI